MKPTILLYHLPEGERLLKIKKALFPLGMKLRAVKKEEYLEPVGYLAGVKEITSCGEIYDGEDFEKEMMVMAGLTSGQVDRGDLGAPERQEPDGSTTKQCSHRRTRTGMR